MLVLLKLEEDTSRVIELSISYQSFSTLIGSSKTKKIDVKTNTLHK